MDKTLYLVICSVALLCGTASAQSPSPRDKDETAIRAIIVELNQGWSTGNAEPWGRHFTADADFVAVNGRRYKGRDEIRKGHQTLFAGNMKNTKQRYNVHTIRFLSDDLAVVHSKGAVVPNNEEFPTDTQVMPVMIFIKEKRVWLISVFQNLRMPPTQSEIKRICEQQKND